MTEVHETIFIVTLNFVMSNNKTVMSVDIALGKPHNLCI